MLASYFLSAEQLGLSTKQLTALIDVLGRLERGEFKHISEEDFLHDDRHSINIVGFNMGAFACGSVHCIGGWADRLHGTDFATMTANYNPHKGLRWLRLYELFYCDETPIEMEEITPAEAAEALRNYLTTGDAQWAKVIGGL